MNVKLRVSINKNCELTIELPEERDLKEALLKVSPFMWLPKKCGICQSEKVGLSTKTDKKSEYIFVSVRCFDCGAEAQFGERKNPKGALFLKQWAEAYGGGQRNAPPEENDQ